MIIQNSVVAMANKHEYTMRYEKRESYREWRDAPAVTPGTGKDRVEISPHSREALNASLEAQKNQADQTESGGNATARQSQQLMGDLEMNLFKILMERLFGMEIDLSNLLDQSDACDCAQQAAEAAQQIGATAEQAKETAAPERQGWGMVYTSEESFEETERAEFAATGTITTTDGEQIDFTVDLSISRHYMEKNSLELRAGDALIDPLVLNFDGTAAQLTTDKFAFDLNADGQLENISFVTPGNGMLALDRNNNGQVDDGTELFGPISGDGYSDLANLDQDGNGWIDEGDQAFNRLRLWTKDPDGKDRLSTLRDKGVGALYLGHASTLFSLKGAKNQTLGQISQTGLFLQETGAAGLMHQLNLAV